MMGLTEIAKSHGLTPLTDGIGKSVEGGASVTDTLRDAGYLDITTVHQPLKSEHPDTGEIVDVGGSAVYGYNIRDDDGRPQGAIHLANAGKRFTGFSNEALGNLVDMIGDEVEPLRVGLIDGGRGTFIEARIPGAQVEIRPGDFVDFVVMMMTRHDTKKALTGMVSTKRLVCMNQWAATHAAMSGVGLAWTCNHTSGIESAARRMAASIRLASTKGVESMTEAYQAMSSRPVTREQWKSIVETALPMPRKLENIDGTEPAAVGNVREARRVLAAAIDHETTAHGREGTDLTAWDVLQAATFYANHAAGSAPNRRGAWTPERRMRESIFSNTGIIPTVSKALAAL